MLLVVLQHRAVCLLPHADVIECVQAPGQVRQEPALQQMESTSASLQYPMSVTPLCRGGLWCLRGAGHLALPHPACFHVIKPGDMPNIECAMVPSEPTGVLSQAALSQLKISMSQFGIVGWSDGRMQHKAAEGTCAVAGRPCRSHTGSCKQHAQGQGSGGLHAPLVLQDLGNSDALGHIDLQDTVQEVAAGFRDLHARRDLVVAPDDALQLLRTAQPKASASLPLEGSSAPHASLWRLQPAHVGAEDVV